MMMTPRAGMAMLSRGLADRWSAWDGPAMPGHPTPNRIDLRTELILGWRRAGAVLRSWPCARRCPWPTDAVVRLERRDPIAKAFGERDVVPAVEQPHAANRVDREGMGALAASDRLLLEIDGHRKLWRRQQGGRHLGCFLLGDDCRQQPVLHGVAGKDVAERGRDHASNAEIVERIDRGFARRAAAEIAAADEDLRRAPSRSVERKVRPLAAVGVEAQVLQQHLSEAGRP